MKPSSPRRLSSARSAASARRAGAALAAILERLEVRLEHGRQSSGGATATLGQRPCGTKLAASTVGAAAPASSSRRCRCAVPARAADRRRAPHWPARQQAGQHDAPARRGEIVQRRGEALQRSEQNVGEHEIERRARRAWLGAVDAVRAHELDQSPARLSRALARATRTALGVDVGRQHALPQRARGGDGEHARAGAEVENARPRATARRLADPVERQQAAARGAVMAGAEGERRFDLDADAVGATRARSCAPCTTKRPAATGSSPARLSPTQSFAATRAKAAPGRHRRRPRRLPVRARRGGRADRESGWRRSSDRGCYPQGSPPRPGRRSTPRTGRRRSSHLARWFRALQSRSGRRNVVWKSLHYCVVSTCAGCSQAARQNLHRPALNFYSPSFPQYLPDLFTALSTAAALFAATMTSHQSRETSIHERNAVTHAISIGLHPSGGSCRRSRHEHRAGANRARLQGAARHTRPQPRRPESRPAPRPGAVPRFRRRASGHEGARYGGRRRLLDRVDGARGGAERHGVWAEPARHERQDEGRRSRRG